jgi:lipoate-protein ligase A
LQHGTLPLTGDLSRICDALAFPDEEARYNAKNKVLARAITLETALGRTVSWEVVAHVIVQGFIQTFGAEFEVGVLSASERAQAEQIAQSTYTNFIA